MAPDALDTGNPCETCDGYGCRDIPYRRTCPSCCGSGEYTPPGPRWRLVLVGEVERGAVAYFTSRTAALTAAGLLEVVDGSGWIWRVKDIPAAEVEKLAARYRASK